MQKGWISPKVEGEKYIPLENYEGAVAQFNDQLTDLNQKIMDARKTLIDIETTVHQTMVDKVAMHDKLIEEQHQIKDAMLNDAAALQKMREEHHDAVNRFMSHKNDHEAAVARFENEFGKRVQALKDDQEAVASDMKDIEEKIAALDVDNELLKQDERRVSDEIASNASRNAFLSVREMEICQKSDDVQRRNDELALKSARYRSDVAELMNRIQDFDKEKQATYAQAQALKQERAEIDQKIEQHKALILQASRVQVDTTNKLNLIRDEGSRLNQQIMELQALKNSLTSQGASNV